MVGADGNTILVNGPGGEERHVFGSAEEAQGRAAFITEALTWLGTPFVNCGDVKGPSGAVDCAMLLVRSSVDTGLIPPFDPRPYSPAWMQHRSEEKFLNILTRLGAKETATPRVGDIPVWQVARTFAHGAIIINSAEVVHAFASQRRVVISRMDEPLLRNHPTNVAIPRAVRYFNLWG